MPLPCLPRMQAKRPPLPAPAPEPEPAATPAVQLVTAQPSGPLPGRVPLPESAVLPIGTASTTQALALPAPTPAAPEITDTRPSRPPGVGPSVTPAPAAFTPVPGLPTLPPQPDALAGPVPASRLVGAPAAGNCSLIGSILSQVPEASNWTQLLTVRSCCAAAPPRGKLRRHAALNATCGQQLEAPCAAPWRCRPWACPGCCKTAPPRSRCSSP